MKVVIPSKNGKLFLPYCLLSLSRTVPPDWEIVIYDRGSDSTAFYEEINMQFAGRFSTIIPASQYELNVWKYMTCLQDDCIVINDTLIVKSPKFFQDLVNPDTDIRMWKTFNVMNDTTEDTYQAMLDWIPSEYWTEDGCHGTILKISRRALHSMLNDGLFERFETFDRTIHGFMFERLLASYVVLLGGTSSQVEKGTIYQHRHGITIVESETAIKYFTSSLFSYNRFTDASNKENLKSLMAEIKSITGDPYESSNSSRRGG